MSEQEKIKKAVALAIEYTPPAWIKILVKIAVMLRWVGALGASGGVLFSFASTKTGLIVFSAAYGLSKLIELLGDFLDDQKFNDSFKEALEKETV